jgi:hypothetical protein
MLERGLVRLGAGVAEDDVMEARGRERGQLRGQTDRRLGGGVEEGRIEGDRAHLLGNGVGDLQAAVAHVRAPEAGEAVEDLAAVLVDERRAARRTDHVRARLVHGALVGEGMEVVRLVEAAQGGEVEGGHAENGARGSAWRHSAAVGRGRSSKCQLVGGRQPNNLTT